METSSTLFSLKLNKDEKFIFISFVQKGKSRVSSTRTSKTGTKETTGKHRAHLTLCNVRNTDGPQIETDVFTQDGHDPSVLMDLQSLGYLVSLRYPVSLFIYGVEEGGGGITLVRLNKRCTRESSWSRLDLRSTDVVIKRGK